MSNDTLALPIGFQFRPTDEQLVNHYLKRKITGEIQYERELIPEVDVYKYDPWDLPAKAVVDSGDNLWYFFAQKDENNACSSSTSLALENGYWKVAGKDRVIKSDQQNAIGMVKSLVFHKGQTPGERTNWVMHEYRIIGPDFDSSNQVTYVLCRLFRKFGERISGLDQKDPAKLIELNAEVIGEIMEPIECKNMKSAFQENPLTIHRYNLTPHGAETQVDYMKALEASSRVGSSIIFGREYEKKKIIELALSDNPQNHDVNFLCLVSDRGIGKTTMLNLVYNDERVCDSFDMRLFITLPDYFDEKMLLRMIIESLTCAACGVAELETLEEILKEELAGKKFLFVMDNFENVDQRIWNIPLALLNVSLKGSAIVVLTRRETISNFKKPVQCNYYYLNHLSNHWCWMIFYHYALNGQDASKEPHLVKIGKHLVSKCGSIPLCIKVLSALLSHSFTENWWKTISENILWESDEMGGDILPALRVCYDLLSPHLKQCFMYCSLFPKNYLFSRKQLVYMWLSQGFIKSLHGGELEQIGCEYFDELLSRSFFQHSPFHSTKEDKFVMHGLIHDLAQHVAINECFRFEGCMQKVPENVYHLSLVPNEYQSVSLKDLTTETEKLQSFMVVPTSALQQEIISSYIVNLVHLDDLFVKFGSLAVLNLSYTDIEELPNSVRLLKTLRYLALNGTKIKCIPLEICNSVYLETLEASNCYYLEELPENMWVLTNLRNLDVNKESGNIIMPSGIGRVVNLRSLPTFNVGNNQSQCRIEELKNLNYLKGSLKICGLENVGNGIYAKEADLSSKAYLETLSLHWSDAIIYDEDDDNMEIADALLENLQPPCNIRELNIRNYPGIKFPIWIEFSVLQNLVSIILDNCYNCPNLPNLGELPMLRHLSIQKMYAIHKLNLYNGYPSLEVLNIWEMYGLVEWVEIKDGDFPRLRNLSINRCPFLMNLPSLPSLVDLSIFNCTKLPEITELPSLESLKIDGFLKIKFTKLPEGLIRLKVLEITQCPELSLVGGLPKVSSLEKIKISGCPKLCVSKNSCSIYLKENNDLSVLARDKVIDLSEMLPSEFIELHLLDEFVNPPSPIDKHEHEVLSTKREDLSSVVSEAVQAEEEKKLEDHFVKLALQKNAQNNILQENNTPKSLMASDPWTCAHSDTGMVEDVHSKQSDDQNLSKPRKILSMMRYTHANTMPEEPPRQHDSNNTHAEIIPQKFLQGNDHMKLWTHGPSICVGGSWP